MNFSLTFLIFMIVLIYLNNLCMSAKTNRPPPDPCKPKGGKCQSGCVYRVDKDLGTAPGCNNDRCCKKYTYWSPWPDPCKKAGKGFCSSMSGCYTNTEQDKGTEPGCNTRCCKKIGKIREVVPPGSLTGKYRGRNLNRQLSRSGTRRVNRFNSGRFS